MDWFLALLLFLITIGYTAMSVGEKGLAVITLLAIFGVSTLWAVLRNLINLWKTKDLEQQSLTPVILFYLGTAFSFICFFGFVFSIASAFDGNGIVGAQDKIKLVDTWGIIYFSAATFYSTSLGEYFPLGGSRWIMITESLFSLIVHVIILGIIISNFNKPPAKSSPKKAFPFI